jgi:hypothetical protein
VIDVSTKVDWPAYAGLGVLGAYLIWVLVAPDKAWRLERVFVAWQYRDGDRIELSPAGRAWVRFTSLVGMAVLLFGVGLTFDWSAAAHVRTETTSDSDTIYHVADSGGPPDCTVRIIVCLENDVVFPIEVTDYEELDPASGHEGLSVDTDLVLYLPDRFFPTHLVRSEQDDRVTVSLYGKCVPEYPWDDPVGNSAAECESDAWEPSDTGGLVPVTLDRELGDRTVLDGHRHAPVDRRDAAEPQ